MRVLIKNPWSDCFDSTQVYYTAGRMRTTHTPGEACNVKPSWFHSFAASHRDCCDWSFADVCVGEDRLEGEFTRIFLFQLT